jgi:PadR family transcriptional regulator, regulatory protein AphA
MHCMSLRHAVLGLLAGRPMTGYDLARTFDGSLAHVWPASHSQIYPELARLADAGLIRQSASGSRGKRIYEITPDGLDEIRAWLRTEPDHGSRNSAFLRVFFLWLMEPAEAIGFLEDEARFHEETLRGFEAVADQPPSDREGAWAFRLALEWGMRYERGIIEWSSWARNQIRSMAGGAGFEPASPLRD